MSAKKSMAEDAVELSAILERMEVSCKVACTQQLGKHMSATKDLGAKAELFAECPMVWWPFEEFVDYCDAVNGTKNEATTTSKKVAVGFCEYCGRIGTDIDFNREKKKEEEAQVSWRPCAECSGCSTSTRTPVLYCSDACQAKGSGGLHAFLNCDAIAKVREYQRSEVRQQTRQIEEERKKEKEEAKKKEAVETDNGAEDDEEEEIWNFFPISVEALARAVVTLALQYYKLHVSYPDETVETLFAHASQRFNRFVEPPEGVAFGEIRETEWYKFVAETMRPALCAVFASPDAASSSSRVVDALLSKDTLRTMLGQLSLNAQALNITWPPTHQQQEQQEGMTASEETKEQQPQQRPVSVAGGIFMLQSCFNHSCYPNTELVFSDTNEITVRTKRAVAKGDQLCITYIPEVYLALENTEQRRRRLSSYFFVCQCECCNYPKSAASGEERK